jgi:DNA repair exonuclease SbcCD ATPase subunit
MFISKKSYDGTSKYIEELEQRVRGYQEYIDEITKLVRADYRGFTFDRDHTKKTIKDLMERSDKINAVADRKNSIAKLNEEITKRREELEAITNNYKKIKADLTIKVKAELFDRIHQKQEIVINNNMPEEKQLRSGC